MGIDDIVEEANEATDADVEDFQATVTASMDELEAALKEVQAVTEPINDHPLMEEVGKEFRIQLRVDTVVLDRDEADDE